MDEALETLDAAIEYKNESIQNRQEHLKKSVLLNQVKIIGRWNGPRERTSHLFLMREKLLFLWFQSESNIVHKLNSLTIGETRTLLQRYFEKVIDLKESMRKKDVACSELQVRHLLPILNHLKRFNHSRAAECARDLVFIQYLQRKDFVNLSFLDCFCVLALEKYIRPFCWTWKQWNLWNSAKNSKCGYKKVTFMWADFPFRHHKSCLAYIFRWKLKSKTPCSRNWRRVCRGVQLNWTGSWRTSSKNTRRRSRFWWGSCLKRKAGRLHPALPTATPLETRTPSNRVFAQLMCLPWGRRLISNKVRTISQRSAALFSQNTPIGEGLVLLQENKSGFEEKAERTSCQQSRVESTKRLHRWLW